MKKYRVRLKNNSWLSFDEETGEIKLPEHFGVDLMYNNDLSKEQIKIAHKRAEENDYGDLLRKYNNLKTALDESQEVVISYKEENKNLKDLCDKYEEEHKTTFEEWKKDIKANKKAIEYIGQHFIEEGSCEINKITGEYTCEGNENFLEELLDILQGSDRE